MVLKLVGAPKATCTRRVAAILHEKRVPFEVVPVNMAAGEHKSPAYLEKHPFGVVPYIVCPHSLFLFGFASLNAIMSPPPPPLLSTGRRRLHSL